MATSLKSKTGKDKAKSKSKTATSAKKGSKKETKKALPSAKKNIKSKKSASANSSSKKKKSKTKEKSTASQKLTKSKKNTTSSKKVSDKDAKKKTKKVVVKGESKKIELKKALKSTAKTSEKNSNKKSLKTNVSVKKRSSGKKPIDALKESKREKLKLMVDDKNQQDSPPITPMIAAPTDKMLKPFRDAAKRNLESKVKNEKLKKKGGFLAKPPKKGKKYTFDLRVHSPVSEGYFSTGGVDPASAMVRLAKSKGLDIIAVTDYNSADFVDQVKEKANETSITVLPGIDLTCSIGSCDEVSFVALFPEKYGSKELNEILEELGIPENAKGRKSFTLREEFKKVIKVIESYEGILIPTRLDKTPHRILAVKQLVEEYGFHAFDLVHPENPEYFKQNWPTGEFTFMSFSNANALGQIGSRHMKLKLLNPGFDGIKVLVSRRESQKSATK